MTITLIILFIIFFISLCNKFANSFEYSFNIYSWKFISKYRFVAFFFNPYPISKEIQEVLLNRFQFYKNFPEEVRHFYNYRLRRLIDSFEFVSSNPDLIISDTDKAVVLANANRMVLGFREYLYRSCRIIELHPDEYFSEQLKQWHKGETALNGVIKLSLKHLNEGDINNNDGINLAIHEYAHAIMIELFTGDERLGFYDRFMDYKYQAIEDVDKIREKGLLRNYAYVNDHEFFAVSTEVFFETPETLKNNVPNFYNVMCRLYNQQPHLANPLTQTI